MNLTESQLKKVALFYDLDFDRTLSYDSGYRNASHMFQARDGLSYNFILYKNESGITKRIRNIHRLSNHLSGASLPIRRPVDERILSIDVPSAKRYGALYNFLPGQTIAWEMYSMKHIKLLGFAIGRLHECLLDYEDAKLPIAHDIAVRQLKVMSEYLNRGDVIDAMSHKLGISVKNDALLRLATTLDEASRISSVQPLHLDFVRGNLLFDKSEDDSLLSIGEVAITGIIDFEKAAVGPIVFDIARSLSFLYVDCNKPESKIRKYFIDSGYLKRAKQIIDPDNYVLIEPTVDFYLLYDLYKFLSQNPYEFLAENHHYLETAAILSSRQLLY